MSTCTASREFLADLGDINGFIADLLGCARTSRWHWPSFYLLYVDVDRLSMLLMRLHQRFACSGGESDAPSLADFAADIHGLLQAISQRQKAIVGALWSIYRATKPTTAQQACHGRVGAHVHPKSGWYQTFMRQYGRSEVANGGLVLVRVALPIDQRLSDERIDFISAECMLQYQSFDIGTSQARASLMSAVQAAEQRIGSVLALMGSQLSAHCRIEDLLHPCSH